MTDAPPPSRASALRKGFTLIELLVAIAIAGLLLSFVAFNPAAFGDRNRLESAASTVVSVLTAARELAIIDGHETRVQFDLPGTTKDRRNTGRFRYLVTSQSRQKSKALMDDAERKEADARKRRGEAAEEWVETEWRSLPDGVVMEAFSAEAGVWIRANPRGDPVEVSFEADGTVLAPCALRLLSVDMKANAARALTVLVNPLTSVAEVAEGEADLPKGRDPSDFR